jgi:membrane fusion protein, multidrug efflux system
MPIRVLGRSTGRHGSHKSVWVLFLSCLLAVVLAGCGESGASAGSAPGGAGKGGGGRKGGGGDVPVLVTKVTQRNVPVEIQVIGNVEAYSTISVRSQVTGQLTSANFREGDFVKKGEQLFSIDPRPLEATLNQVQANLARDEATLGQAQAVLARDSAQARYTESQATRYAQLFEQKVISRDQAEQSRASADASAQAVAADRAIIESAKAAIGATRAAVENAKLNLAYTSIKSPIDGRTGNVTVKTGNIVTANNQELMTINQVEPIYVTFSVPEAQLSAIKTYMAQGKLVVRARPQGESTVEESGVLTFVDNAVDTATGTIKLKGTFENKSHSLWPGQFVRVTLRLTTRTNATVVLNQAVQTGQAGSYVYVVREDRTVESRPVTTGARVDDDLVVESGLQPGETVVSEGQLRLAPGARVAIRDGRGGGRGEGRRGAEAGGREGESAPAEGGEGRKGAGRKGAPKS